MYLKHIKMAPLIKKRVHDVKHLFYICLKIMSLAWIIGFYPKTYAEINLPLPTQASIASAPFQAQGEENLTEFQFVRLIHADAEEVAKILERKQSGEGILS